MLLVHKMVYKTKPSNINAGKSITSNMDAEETRIEREVIGKSLEAKEIVSEIKERSISKQYALDMLEQLSAWDITGDKLVKLYNYAEKDIVNIEAILDDHNAIKRFKDLLENNEI